MVVLKNVTQLFATRIVIQQKMEKMATVTVFVLTTPTILAWVEPVSKVCSRNNERFRFINDLLKYLFMITFTR